MIDLHLGANAPRWRFLYAVRIDAYVIIDGGVSIMGALNSKDSINANDQYEQYERLPIIDRIIVTVNHGGGLKVTRMSQHIPKR